jgi:hypothetical protein
MALTGRLRLNDADGEVPAEERLTFASIAKALGAFDTQHVTLTDAIRDIREPLDAFAAALRTYIVKVMGHVEDDEPDTRALADKLLQPLAAWDIGPSTKTAAAATSPEAPMNAPAPGAPVA